MRLRLSPVRIGLDRAVSLIALISFIVILYPVHPLAGDQDAFSISTLSVADKVLDLETVDFDQDGLKDILVVHRKGLQPDETRWISIFLQGRGGDFSTAADQSWEIDTTAVILDVGDVYGDPKKEICFLSAVGVFYYTMEERSFNTIPQKLFDSQGLAVHPSKRNIPVINFVRDWNGDGIEEIGIYQFEGLSIFSPDSTHRYDNNNKLTVELDTYMHSRKIVEDQDQTAGLSATFRFPTTRIIDYNADGREDLIATVSERIFVYIQDENGSFSGEPYADVVFDVRTQKEKIEDIAFAQTVMRDLNDDGYADAIVTKQSSQGLSNFRCAINIFYGTSGGFSEKPDQVIISEGTASERTIVRDVNGDGQLDMILPSIKISITSIIRFLLTKSVPINFNIFLLHEDGRYSDRPDFSKEVKFKIDFSGETDVQAVSLQGDFNGDDRKDFVFGTGEDELSIFLGVSGDKERIYSKKPVVRLDVPAFGELLSLDLDDNGYSDMVIYYPQSKTRKGMINVMVNREKIR
ncbi:MAG: VCBS repeat-containing protein [Candidatus Krumholzibacteriota bacterium]|nr:VCBS repeat-containing protein [Candidatus Krumholzibacteriota bacterium]